MTKKHMKPVIELRGLKKRFGVGNAENFALGGIDLTINQGEFIAIMGPSGCGKTTLLNILGLLDRATEGSYLLDGKPVHKFGTMKKARIRSKSIGIVFQNFNMVQRLNVIENVALPLTYTGMGKIRRLKRASEILRTFHLSEREYYMPWQLSGGQTQRVAIARALVNNPSIILADEPTGNLDSKTSHLIMQELTDLHKQGNTIIMVTHNPDLTAYASRVIHMVDGFIDSDTADYTPEPSASDGKRSLSIDADEPVENEVLDPTKTTEKTTEEAVAELDDSNSSTGPVGSATKVKKVKLKNLRKRDRK
jgi:ABC transporter-related protein